MAIVNRWVNKHVPADLIPKFRKHMIRWDESLRSLPISHWPTYDEDVLFTALKYAKEDYQ